MSRASRTEDDVTTVKLKSPASPVLASMNGLGPQLKKAATVFPSHVRRTFGRMPTDYTGDLVRLLDDISTVTHSIAAYINEGSESVQYGTIQSATKLDPAVATRQLYKALSYDGYCCLILERHTETPMNLYVFGRAFCYHCGG